MPDLRWSRSLLRDIGLVLLAVVTVAAALHVLTRNPQEPAARIAAQSQSPVASAGAAPAVRALVVGEPKDAALAEVLEEELDWQVTSSLVADNGFLAGNGKSYVKRVPTLLQDALADVVVLSAGTTDGQGDDPRRYAANVAFVLNEIREALPRARVVVVGPVAPDDSFGGTRRQQLAAVASRFGAFFVDPIGRGYLAIDPGLLEPDGTLAARGQQGVARLVAADLARVLPAYLLPDQRP